MIAALSQARWFDGARARGYGLILAGMSLVVMLVWGVLALAHGGLDPMGKPLGADYPSFWAASRLALNGKAAGAYDLATHYAVQTSMFRGAPIGYSAFFYPPPYLLICLPLALLPYAPSLLLWLGATAAMAKAALQPLLRDRHALLALIAYPAVMSNLAHGQNAFLTTALFTYGLTRVERRPWLAGLALGLLVIKPHLALVVPFSLMATGRWRTFWTTGAWALAFCAASYLALGADVWRGFFATNALARAALEQDLVGNEKMQSLFAAVRLVGGPLWLAWGAQALTSVATLTVLVWASRKTRDVTAQAALAGCAALLASPFLLDYDLMLGALPMLWLMSKGRESGFLDWEKLGLAAAFLLPLVSRLAGAALHVPLAPLALASLYALTVRRAISCDSRH